jgi:hypothetical protein
MQVNRREFIILGVAGAVAGCNKGTETSRLAGPRLGIGFVGLCGVVVNGSPATMEVLLVDGVQTLGEGHEHVPRLYAPKQRVAQESTPPAGNEGSLAFWELKDHRVRLVSSDTTGVIRVTGHRDPAHKKPTSETEQDDVSWVAGMARIAAAGSGKINPACLADDPRPGKVAASARFNAGEMTSRFRPPFHEVAFRVAADGESNPFEQALGELHLSHQLSDTVTFALEPFAGGTVRQIILRPQGNNLDVQIKNLPAQVKCTTDEEVRTLSHFAAFYQLLATPSSSSPVPVCADTPCQLRCVGHEDEPIYCPPTEFQG